MCHHGVPPRGQLLCRRLSWGHGLSHPSWCRLLLLQRRRYCGTPTRNLLAVGEPRGSGLVNKLLLLFVVGTWYRHNRILPGDHAHGSTIWHGMTHYVPCTLSLLGHGSR